MVHVEWFGRYGSVPSWVWIDNLKTGVVRGGPTAVLNRSYETFAGTCGLEIDPRRPATGSDKGKAGRGGGRAAQSSARSFVAKRARSRNSAGGWTIQPGAMEPALLSGDGHDGGRSVPRGAAPPCTPREATPVELWHHVVRGPTFCDAILDRLLDNVHRIHRFTGSAVPQEPLHALESNGHLR